MTTQETPTILQSLLISDAENPKPSASPAAILEIQTSSGAVLLPHLTPKALAQLASKKEDGSRDAVNGMSAYEGFTHGLVVFADGHWRRLVTEKLTLPDVSASSSDYSS